MHSSVHLLHNSPKPQARSLNSAFPLIVSRAAASTGEVPALTPCGTAATACNLHCVLCIAQSIVHCVWRNGVGIMTGHQQVAPPSLISYLHVYYLRLLHLRQLLSSIKRVAPPEATRTCRWYRQPPTPGW